MPIELLRTYGPRLVATAVVGALGGTASSFVALGQDVSKLHEKARTCEQRFARIESQNLATHAAVDELLRAVGRLEGQSRE